MGMKFGAVVAALLATALAGCTLEGPGDAGAQNAGPSVGPSVGGPAVMRRLTAAQYRQVILDVFGPSITLGGRFEPDHREGGLIAVGAGRAGITATGFEQYERMARSIAAQIVDEQHRRQFVPCSPASATEPDAACAQQFLGAAGRLLYRRTLTAQELASQVDRAAEATRKVHDFHKGLGLSLAGMLSSPHFLFVQEFTEADPAVRGAQRLDGYAKATRLSLFFWNALPDEELLAAAEGGELHTAKGLARQVDRLLASPRLEAGLRAFFADMLGFETFDTLAKDSTLYPKFTFRVALNAQEQTLLTLTDLLLTQNGDYRDVFTTRKTFLTPLLASVYRVKLASPNGLADAWVPYEFPADSQQAGILTQASFVALHSHPGRSSPTLRGKALRETLLCQKVPAPPGNVNFNIVQDTANPTFKTVRQRLKAHATEAMCAGCHKITDPMGLALENFDTIGGYRESENGSPIDVSGELDGTQFTNAVGLGKAVHDNPAAAACIVKRVFEYGVGRDLTKAETDWLASDLNPQFAADGYRLRSLLRRIATSAAFFRIATEPRASTLAQLTRTQDTEHKP